MFSVKYLIFCLSRGTSVDNGERAAPVGRQGLKVFYPIYFPFFRPKIWQITKFYQVASVCYHIIYIWSFTSTGGQLSPTGVLVVYF